MWATASVSTLSDPPLHLYMPTFRDGACVSLSLSALHSIVRLASPHGYGKFCTGHAKSQSPPSPFQRGISTIHPAEVKVSSGKDLVVSTNTPLDVRVLILVHTHLGIYFTRHLTLI